MPIRLLCLIFLGAAALPAEAQLAKLTIDVGGLEPPTGKVEVSLFANAEDFMREPVLQQTREADGQSELRFELAGLTEGRYGVVVVHDENDNGSTMRASSVSVPRDSAIRTTPGPGSAGPRSKR